MKQIISVSITEVGLVFSASHELNFADNLTQDETPNWSPSYVFKMEEFYSHGQLKDKQAE